MIMLIDIIGWSGAVILLVAYGLVSAHKWNVKSYRYQWLNIIGALLLGVNAVYHRALPSFGIEVAWIAIALIAMFMTRKKNRETSV